MADLVGLIVSRWRGPDRHHPRVPDPHRVHEERWNLGFAAGRDYWDTYPAPPNPNWTSEETSAFWDGADAARVEYGPEWEGFPPDLWGAWRNGWYDHIGVTYLGLPAQDWSMNRAEQRRAHQAGKTAAANAPR